MKPEKNVVRFDLESYCVIHLWKGSGVVRVTSNIATRELAEQYAFEIRGIGGHVFRVVTAGVLVAAMELVVDPEGEP